MTFANTFCLFVTCAAVCCIVTSSCQIFPFYAITRARKTSYSWMDYCSALLRDEWRKH